MAHQNRPSHARNSGTTRERHGRDYAGSRSAARSTNESFTHRQATSRSANSSRRQETGAEDHRHSRSCYREDDAPEYGRSLSHDRYGYHDAYPPTLSYDRVPRPYRADNPEVQRILHDPRLEDAITRIGRRNSPHNRSSARQSGSTPTQPRPRAHSPERYHHNSAPLGMSNLRRLDEERDRIHAMDRYFRQDQRDGPYDAVEWVERPRYVYGERDQQQRQQYQYNEYEDDSSDETLF